MKKALLIGLLLLSVLTASAQIQRKFLGFTLGVTTKTQIVNNLKSRNIKIHSDQDDIYFENITFGGQQWSYVFISFVNGKMAKISFMKDDETTTLTHLKSIYDNLESSLNKKYYQYKTDTSGTIKYSDGTVDICLDCDDSNGYGSTVFLSLIYYHRPLMQKKFQQEEDEL